MSDSNTPSRRNEIRPSSGEAPFEPGEVFYSRTDKRGVIESGNYVFRRVGHYEWEELIGAPHKIIRHPDMPRGIFRIFWDRIQKDQIVGAYVKNKAKDGLHYWVFACVAPLEDGYISCRLKPTSPRLEKVKQLYAQVRKHEEASGCDPAESAQMVLDALREDGFDSYEDFAMAALADELQSEVLVLGLPRDKRIDASNKMLETTQSLVKSSQTLFAEFEVLANIPKNMQIKSALLEPTGGPLTALSKNYGQMSEDISARFDSNVVGKDNNFEKISASVKRALLLNNAAELLQRCNEQLIAERRDLGQLDLDKERKRLVELADKFCIDANNACDQIVTEANQLANACSDIRRSLVGLNTVCINCKIENARLGEDAGSLDRIIDQLRQSQENVEDFLHDIKTSIQSIIDISKEVVLVDSEQIPRELKYGTKMAKALESTQKRPIVRSDAA